MATFAVIETGGKQYKVTSGQKLKVEKLPAQAGDSFVLDKVLLRANDTKVEVGAPYVIGATVEAKVVKKARARKKIVFKFHSKTRYHKKKGHRQAYTELEIVKI